MAGRLPISTGNPDFLFCPLEVPATIPAYPAHGHMAVPAHPVRLPRPFYLGERKVRYRDFLDLMKREPGDEPAPHNEPDGVLLSRCTLVQRHRVLELS